MTNFVTFQLIFMDQIEEVSSDLQAVKGENCIVVKLKEGFKETKVILTNQVPLHVPEINLPSV